jgi:secreted PhoX family phosphatase
MRVVGRPRFDTAVGLKVGDRLPIEWVDIVDAQPVGDTLRTEAASNGAALVRRGEGIWWKDGRGYFVSTTGGPVSGGQVFELDPAASTLRLVVQSNDTSVLHMPDNINVAPWNELFLAEDGAAGNYLRVAHTDGNVADFAYNDVSGSEFCGICFSPDGRALFVNLQLDGLTLVVTGPFPTTSHEPGVDPVVPAPADPFANVDSAGGGGGCAVGASAGAHGHDARGTAVVVGAALLGAAGVRRDES